jgi:large subunit ribosomal protein L35
MKKKKIKIKTKKSIKRRFKITKSGKVLRRSTHLRHLRRKRSKKRIRHLRSAKKLAPPFAKKVKKILGKKL